MQFDFICIEGNIGVGKTTLAKQLSEHLRTKSIYEEFEDNPWLPLFYDGIEGSALTLELSFLTDRARQLTRLEKEFRENGPATVISDYAIDKCLLFAEINLTKEDFGRYNKLHQLLVHRLPQPSLAVVIHTEVEVLLENIRVRDRDFEKMIRASYLQNLNDRYRTYFTSKREYPVLNIFAAQLNDRTYEQIFAEILTFIRLKPASSNTSIQL